MSTHKPIPEGINAIHVKAALADLDRGVPHDFRDATQWALLHEGKSYAPKAAIGLAANHAFGSPLKPSDFSSGEAPRQAVGYLRQLGFNVVPIVGSGGVTV